MARYDPVCARIYNRCRSHLADPGRGCGKSGVDDIEKTNRQLLLRPLARAPFAPLYSIAKNLRGNFGKAPIAC
jgi:hypothetical protein